MPLVEERTFRVRHYECDAFQQVLRSSFLNYMQEAAFDASTAAGYDRPRYVAIGCYWLIRETRIEYCAPLVYGDSVRVRTWVADFRRVRSRRAYEFRRVGAEELVARAHTDWVFLDRETHQPLSIPREMQDAFFPEGPPGPAPPRSRFPDVPQIPPGAFLRSRAVEWQDIDPAQHVNNAVYVAYLEDCGVSLAATYGWSPERMRAEGFVIAARSDWIEYRQPGLLGDVVEIVTFFSDVDTDTVLQHGVVSRASDGALLARSRSVLGAADATTGRAIPIPGAFLDSVATAIANGG